MELLREQAPLESYVEWLDQLVETKIIRVSAYNLACTWHKRGTHVLCTLRTVTPHVWRRLHTYVSIVSFCKDKD